MTYLMIGGRRDTYNPQYHLQDTMTVGDLIEYLSQFYADVPVILCNDNGYTYGMIVEESFEEAEFDEEGRKINW